MLQILAATSNPHKVTEFRSAFHPIQEKLQIITLGDIPPFTMPEENGTTFEENAMIKAKAASAFADMPAFADDSGLGRRKPRPQFRLRYARHRRKARPLGTKAKPGHLQHAVLLEHAMAESGRDDCQLLHFR